VIRFLAMLVFAVVVKAQPPTGKELFEKRCTGCHSLDNDRIGPRIRGVYGRKAGTGEGFPYSDALKGSRVVWNSATLDKWLADPDQLVPGNDMEFRVGKPDERAAIIEFLRTLPPSMNGVKR
jgi:cytochrome c